MREIMPQREYHWLESATLIAQTNLLKEGHRRADKLLMVKQTDSRNYYDVLHVSHDAPLEIIRGSYRTMMQQLKNHPDLGGDPATAALINEAHAVLSDPERRAEYDARLDISEHGTPESPVDPESAPAATRVLDLSRECVFCAMPHEHGNVIEINSTCHTCGSPLCAAEQRRMESAGQRAVERIDKQQRITFYTHWPQRKGFTGRTEDISLNGLRFVTKYAIEKGQRIKIASEVVEAVANVTHCNRERRGWTTRYLAGVSFVTLRFVRSVGAFVSEHV